MYAGPDWVGTRLDCTYSHVIALDRDLFWQAEPVAAFTFSRQRLKLRAARSNIHLSILPDRHTGYRPT